MWFKKLLGVFVTLGLVLAACTGGGTTPSPSGSGDASSAPSDGGDTEQVLRVDLGGEPPTLDPTQATDSQSINVLRSITRPLAYFDENLEVVPGLAEDWEISDDGQQITFTLKDGITYSDGTPITADDFVYSWKRLIDPREAAGYSYVLADVVGGEDLLGVDTETATDEDIDALLDAFGVSAPDESTFVVDLARPASYFVYIATLWVTVPQQEGSEFGEAEGYLSSGPMTDDRVGAPVAHRARAERGVHRRPGGDHRSHRDVDDPGPGRHPGRLRGR